MNKPDDKLISRLAVRDASLSALGVLATVQGQVRSYVSSRLVDRLPKIFSGRATVIAPERRPSAPVGDASIAETETSWAGRALLISFIAIVFVPSLLTSIYFFFIASEQYVVETRVTVRSAVESKQSLSDSMSSSISAFSKLGLSGAKSNTQDAYIFLNYLKSLKVVEDIGGANYLESKFSHGRIDWVSRLPRGEKIEEVTRYWSYNVLATMDTLSGIVTLKVFAFRPEDALEISNKIVALGENLVNRLSERADASAVAQAQDEVQRSVDDFAASRAALQDFRNKSATIDPVAKATSLGELIGKLMVERNSQESELATFTRSLSSDSPAVKIRKNQIETIDRQIADLRRQLTSTDPKAQTVSSDLAKFEQLKLREKFAEQKFSISQMSLQKAEQEMRKQKLFLVLVVPPTLPQFPLFPERGIDSLLAICLFCVIWGIISLVTASVSDHFLV